VQGNQPLPRPEGLLQYDGLSLPVGDDHDDNDDMHEKHMTTMKMTMPGLMQGERLVDEDSNDKQAQ